MLLSLVDIQKSFKNDTAKLYIVPTPIGNLDDITLRALNILKEVSYIACEDTRQTTKLLQHYGIQKPLISYHDHSDSKKEDQLIERLKDGHSIALVSDAGTPIISDPGYPLFKRARAEGIDVVSIPGANAAITALVGSGLPPHPFLFYGFLPKKKQEIIQVLEKLSESKQTVIFYESPFRIKQTIEVMGTVFKPELEIVVARELTKKFEEYTRGSLKDVLEHLKSDEAVLKGEFVLILGPVDEVQVAERFWEELSIEAHVDHYVEKGKSTKEAIKLVATDRGMGKREVYQSYHLKS